MATTHRNKVGRIREKLASLLAKEGFVVRAEDLRSQYPVYATPQWDCCSWDGYGVRKSDGMKVHFSSWDTMTECVKFGMVLTQDPDWYTQYDVSRNG